MPRQKKIKVRPGQTKTTRVGGDKVKVRRNTRGNETEIKIDPGRR